VISHEFMGLKTINNQSAAFSAGIHCL